MRIRHAVAAAAVVLVPALYLTVLNAADSLVADAAMKCDKAAVQTLIKQKADVNLPQADGAEPALASRSAICSRLSTWKPMW